MEWGWSGNWTNWHSRISHHARKCLCFAWTLHAFCVGQKLMMANMDAGRTELVLTCLRDAKRHCRGRRANAVMACVCVCACVLCRITWILGHVTSHFCSYMNNQWFMAFAFQPAPSRPFLSVMLQFTVLANFLQLHSSNGIRCSLHPWPLCLPLTM